MFVVKDRLRCTSTVCLALLVVGLDSCGGDAPLPSQGLPSEQLQFVAFLPREYLLDLRAEAGQDGASRRENDGAGALRLGEGWSTPDNSGRWSLGARSTIFVHLTDPSDRNLFFEYRSPGVESIEVRVNSVDVGELPSQSTWSTHLVSLADGVLLAGENTVELTYTAGPAGFPMRTSDGSLSVYFRTVGVVASEPTAEGEEWSAPYDRDENTVTVGQSGTVVIPYRADRSLASVTVGVSGEGRLWRPIRSRLGYLGADADDDATEGVASSPAVLSLGGVWGRASASAELSLDGRSGPGCFLVDVDLDPTGPPLRLDLLNTEESPPVSLPARERMSEAPDIVLVVLDALRADHVSAYGYARETTPNIDQLANVSLRFDSVFATAPYTLASMATMLSGLSFVQHGVTQRGHRLSESVTTLAEYLNEAGYRTACLSANPNNSVNLGLEQGCDVFEEFWQNAAPPASLDPYRVSRRAVDELRDKSDAPLFLMLHYVPPHEPYAPRPEFDIFGDAAYEGSYDGNWETIRSIDDGTLEPTQADLDEIKSLYDGNLRTGDDAVGLVLDALRQSDRWDRTVVLVTSDHGEAFGEHGRMGHNTTVYDEMLHVPFILRVPDEVSLPAVNTESIASLADVVPTLLGLAGVEPRGRLYGQDLLAPRTTTGRHVVSRSGGERPVYAYRTERWKAIQGGRTTGELYDLATDPDERDDRYLERYQTFVCLSSLLRWELAGSVDAGSGTEETELSEEELRTLRSLGYVR